MRQDTGPFTGVVADLVRDEPEGEIRRRGYRPG